jgi:hypothetical protein
MEVLFRRIGRVVAVALLAGVPSVVPAAASQGASDQTTEETTASLPSPPAALTGDEIIAKLLEHNQLRNAQLQQYSVVRTYEVRNPKGKLSAQEVVRVDYRAPDKKIFQKTSEKGSGLVRHLVFDRLMQSESEASSGREHHDSALTSANYTFTLVGEEDIGPYHCFIVQAAPKRKDKYLFEGRIWIDAQDFAVVRIAGHPAKKPSFWIKRADFVRQYQRIDGFWLPYRDETFVEVKIHGKKIFTIDHQDYTNIDVAPLLRGAQ